MSKVTKPEILYTRAVSPTKLVEKNKARRLFFRSEIESVKIYRVNEKSIGIRNQLFNIPKPVSLFSLNKRERIVPARISALPNINDLGRFRNSDEMIFLLCSKEKKISSKAAISKTFVGRPKIFALIRYRGKQKTTKFSKIL